MRKGFLVLLIACFSMTKKSFASCEGQNLLAKQQQKLFAAIHSNDTEFFKASLSGYQRGLENMRLPYREQQKQFKLDVNQMLLMQQMIHNAHCKKCKIEDPLLKKHSTLQQIMSILEALRVETNADEELKRTMQNLEKVKKMMNDYFLRVKEIDNDRKNLLEKHLQEEIFLNLAGF